MSSHEILENLKKSIVDYDAYGAASWARKAIEGEIDPIEAVDALTEAVRGVGNAFGRGELWLPDLFGAAEAMKSAMPILEEEIRKRGMTRKSLGAVVIGTVFGDIHDIGKTMVATVLTAEGFSVHDLGVNVTTEQFVEAVMEHKADVLAMSSLLTTSALEQQKVIEILNKEGLRDKVKVMVGGGAITEEFAKEIGADGYESAAPGAAELAKKLIGVEE
jgi:corrinoid protein of di/trimethylamine methyltransferase